MASYQKRMKSMTGFVAINGVPMPLATTRDNGLLGIFPPPACKWGLACGLLSPFALAAWWNDVFLRAGTTAFRVSMDAMILFESGCHFGILRDRR